MPRASATGLTKSTGEDLNFRNSRLRLVGIGLLGAQIFVVPLIFDLSLDAPLSVPKALVSHVLAFGLVAVSAGLFVCFGRSLLVWSWLHVPVLAFLGANVIASVFAQDVPLALYGTHVRTLGLTTVADWVVLYFAVVFLVRDRRDAVSLIACGLAASLVALLYALAQLIGIDPFSWTFDGQLAPFSTFGQPTVLAQYLTTLAIFAFSMSVLATPLRWPLRAALGIYALCLLAVAATTGTRSAAVGVAVGVVTLVFLTLVLSPTRRGRAISLVGGLAAAVTLVAVLIFSPVGTRLSASVAQLLAADSQGDLLTRLDPSASSRLALYNIGLQIVREKPFFGYGPDNFVIGVPRFRTDSETRDIQSSLATSAHGWIGHVATSSGAVGLVAFLAIIGVAAGLTLKRGYRPLSIASIATMGAFLGTGAITVGDLGTDWMFWVAIGAIAACTVQAKPAVVATAGPQSRARRRPTPRPSGGQNVVALLCVAAALIPAIASTNAWEASRAARRSQDDRLLAKAALAIQEGLTATRLDPGRPAYWHMLGLAYVGAGRWADASRALERASSIAPYDVGIMGDQARALLAQGDADARAKALRIADRSVQVDPNNPQAQLTRATVLAFTGNPAGGLPSIERAVALDPHSSSPELWITAAQIELALGRATEAEHFASQGIELLGEAKNSVPLRYERARALATLGRQREAFDALNFLLSIQPYAPAENLRVEVRKALGN